MKKIISLILSIVMLLSILPSYAADRLGFDANLSTEEISLLEAVGIFKAGDEFIATDKMDVTRGEFARALMLMLGFGAKIKDMIPADFSYRDVSNSYKYKNEILAASAMGLFGDEVSEWFYPNEVAKKSWACEAIVRLLGYGEQLKANPMYASRLDLMDGFSSEDDVLRRDDALKLIVNTLDVDIMMSIGIDNGNLVMHSETGVGILEQYFDIYDYEGVLTADEYGALSGRRTERGYIRFGDELYLCSMDTKDMLGTNVKYYYRDAYGKKTIVHLEKLNNTVVTLRAADASFDYYANSYTAEVGSKTKSFKMERSTKVIYNGETIFDKALMEGQNTGTITLIDNDSDGSYEVCIIRAYKNIVVQYYNPENGNIYDKASSDGNMCIDDFDSFIMYSDKGVRCEPEALREDQLLTVYISPDRTHATAYISAKGSAAILESYNLADSVAVIDGEEYKLSGDLRVDFNTLHLGQSYYFYINHWNEVAWASANYSYKAFYLMEIDETGGMSSEVKIKGVNTAGDIEIYTLADKVRIMTYAGVANYKAKDAAAKLCEGGIGGRVNRGLVKIDLNSDGKVNLVLLPHVVNTQAELHAMNKDYPLIHAAYLANEANWPSEFLNSGSAQYAGGSYGLFATFSPTVVEYHVPLNTTTSYDEEFIYTSGLKIRTSGESKKPADFGLAYLSGKDRLSLDYLVKEVGASLGSTDDGYFMNPYVVTKVSRVIDEDGMNRTKLVMADKNGNTAEYFAAEEALLSRANLQAEARMENQTANGSYTIPSDKPGVEAGDIVGIELNTNKEIERIRLVYDGRGDRDIHPTDGASASNSTSETVKGRVLRKDGDILEFETIDSKFAQPRILTISAKGSVLEYSFKTQEIKKSSASLVFPGDELVMYLRYGSYNMAVIYRDR